MSSCHSLRWCVYVDCLSCGFYTAHIVEHLSVCVSSVSAMLLSAVWAADIDWQWQRSSTGPQHSTEQHMRAVSC